MALPSSDRARVVIVSGSVGAGHDGVAHELARRLRGRGHPVEVLDLLDGFPAVIRVVLGSGYVLAVKIAPWIYESTCWLVERSRLCQRLADRVCESANSWLLPRVSDADLVVATYPPAGRALGALRRSGRLRVPVVTYLTDPAPNYLWIHPSVDIHLTAAAATAEEVHERYRVPASAAGPLVDAAFRTTDRKVARAAVRVSLGLAPDTRVALVLLGSLGVGHVAHAVDALAAAGFVPVVMCGRNERLHRRVHRRPGAVALGWRDDVASLVCGADLVVHNAGGLSLTESQVAGTPAITFACLPGHGRANARSLERSGAAPWARSAAQLTALALKPARSRPWPLEDETATARISALAEVARRHVSGRTVEPSASRSA